MAAVNCRDAFREAQQFLFTQQQPQQALAVLLPLSQSSTAWPLEEKRPVFELLGWAWQRVKDYEAATQAFQAIQDDYQAGYSQMLKGDMTQAAAHWQDLLTVRPNHWCVTLHGMIHRSMNRVPTFLQVRNHLEADIVHLIAAGQFAMVESILQYIPILGEVNLEAHKYAGRALLQSNYPQLAENFLLTGQRLLPNDPEVYYHMGQYYWATQQFAECRLMLKQCLLISDAYTPARMLLAQLPA